ncbi:DUF4232 domain-containing protein [Streptomyces sp. p1417]|uniref:DUF4232 domain-containing protein n=1 Tax=Streptomyces typhae TaxID=2681492 RepID=A0A6L6WX04_9ACTN|nr:DUF4232 domain-containing protein [Streptomyces typhae]MVO85356.1 DUF4232 domain-containing protein [Streptomyces typhae]
MRVRKLTFAALAVAAGLTLTACNDGDDKAGTSPSAESSTSSTGGGSGGAEQGGGKDSAGKDSAGEGSAEEGTGGQGTVAGTGSNEGGKIGKCRTDELDISAQDSTIDGDSEGTVAITFKNGGGRDCALSGFAGVDLKTSEGALSAQRKGQGAAPMTLKDGESVSFGVTYPVNDSGGSGVSVSGLVVTPPGETKSFSVEWPGAATLPVTDGAGSPVKVGPIGSAGQGGAN